MPPNDSATPRSPVRYQSPTELRAALNPKRWFKRIDKLIDQEQVRLPKFFSDEDCHRVCDELEN